MSFTERVKSQSRDSLNSFEGSQQATAEESALGCPPSSPLVGDAQSAQSPDNLETQLETLRLKVSPETQKDITNVLESLKGTGLTWFVCMASQYRLHFPCSIAELTLVPHPLYRHHFDDHGLHGFG